MANLIHNERLKYSATFFNNVGVAAFVTGSVLPIFQAFPPVAFALSLTAGTALAMVCFFGAQHLLGQLKE